MELQGKQKSSIKGSKELQELRKMVRNNDAQAQQQRFAQSITAFMVRGGSGQHLVRRVRTNRFLHRKDAIIKLQEQKKERLRTTKLDIFLCEVPA